MTNTTNAAAATKLNRFARIEIDGVTPPAKTDAEIMEAIRGLGPVIEIPVVKAPQTEAERAERVVADREAATAAGFKVKDVIFTEGQAVVSLGVENAAISRAEWAELPEAKVALKELARMVRAEQREDLVVSSHAVELTGGNGDHLTLGQACDQRAGESFKIETMGIEVDEAGKVTKAAGPMSAFDLLCRQNEIGNGASFLRECSPGLRKATYNARIGEGPDREMKLRTRTVGGTKGVFAVTGPKYQPLDPDLVMDTIIANLPDGGRADVVYHQSEARGVADVIFHSDVRPEDYACGEIFKAGLRIRWDDCSRGALNLDALVWRNLCLNLIVIDLATLKLAKVVHAGDFAKRLAAVAQGLAKGKEAIGHFVKRWGFAKGEELSTETGRISIVPSKVDDAKTWGECSVDERVAGIMAGLSTTGRVPVRIAQIPGLVEAYRKDTLTGGDTITRAGIVNAVTRYAHESLDRWSADALERAAGSMTWDAKPVAFQYVSVLG